ncbi:Flagellar hook protein FlgE [Desulfurella amilsii]|uniref:Flagellar hook protein FlgE n=1 Tax=Desulfurella amilsii TaxID=1562698 RepID=A0A1X4XUS5_9BACT|nr:flagellar hook-basal body complex protein [Desulfurella amilsii]OSS41284.1 Flagellar hook protein FlgE [Desulfurella amilsii]
MDSGFWIAQGALLGNQFAIDTVSNNVANVNTVGFKSSSTNFADLLYQTTSEGTASTNPLQVGLGSQVAANSLNLSQGSIQPTSTATNIALNGNGFFMVQNGPSSNPNYYFTRAGDFSFDANNNLVDPSGNFVVGWMASPSSSGTGFTLSENPTTGIPTTSAGVMNISNYQKVPAAASTYVKMQGNLDPASSVTQYAQALPTSDFSMLYDSNGNSLNVQPGNNFAVSYNGGTTYHIYEYQPSGTAATPGTEGFSTINDLITKMNQDIQSDTGMTNSVGFNNGQITIANSGSSNISVKVLPTSQVPSLPTSVTPSDNASLDQLVEPLSQPIAPGQSISSSTINADSYTMQATFYDSTGTKHNLNITFTKSAYNKTNSTTTWDWQANLPNNDATLSNNTGQIVFDSNGGLDPSITSPTINISSFNSGASNMSLQLNFWNTSNANYSGNQFTGLTQFGMNSNTSSISSDGSASGMLQSVNFNASGDLVGIYSNGNSYTIGKVAVANFTNPQGLAQVGSNLFQITANTDSPQTIASKSYIGVAGEGTRGTISPSSLEQSNVDLNTQLTNMILYERAYQANTKSLQTMDQVIQTAIQLKQ